MGPRLKARTCLFLWFAFLLGCGYSVRSARHADGTAYALRVAPVVEPGIDVDAAAHVSTGLRRAVVREAGLDLVEGPGDGELTVEILGVTTGLTAFAEPNLRAATYEVRVTLRGTLREGERVVRMPAMIGAAPFVSPPGAIESLDGAGRRALERAAEQAADRVVATMMVRMAKTRDRASSKVGTSSSGQSLRPEPPH